MFRIDEKIRYRFDIEKEIKKIIDREAMAHGIMGDEICNVEIGLTEDQKDVFEVYELIKEFSPLHYQVEGEEEPDDETGLYIYVFSWSETGFINTNDEGIQKIILDALGYTWRERNSMMEQGDFQILEAHAWVDRESFWIEENWKEYADDEEGIDDVWSKLYGAYNADDLLEEIKANHFHPGDGRDSVNVDEVWFVVEVAL